MNPTMALRQATNCSIVAGFPSLHTRRTHRNQTIVAHYSESLSCRKSVKFHPSVWGDYFIQKNRHVQDDKDCKFKERIEELKEQVMSLFKDAAAHDLRQTMNLVYSIQLLGLKYHFEKEVNEAVERIYDANVDGCDLYETALWFQLLREYGYNVSSDVFNKFKDEGGSFSCALKDDVEGLLSLYNAAFLGTHSETILDEAIAFSRSHLQSSLSGNGFRGPLASQVSLALGTPLPRKTRKLLTRQYISIYEGGVARDDALLQLAKLEYNQLQSLHIQELKKISKWWNDLAFAKSLPFTRDRVVECYYWVVAAMQAPYYSRARVMATKVIALISIMDDIYDNYSTVEENLLLTEAIERWEVKAVDGLPGYMKDFYLKLISSFEEFENELAAEEKYRMAYLKEEMKSLARNYHKESRWCAEKYVPMVEEHLELSMRTSAYCLASCACYVGMGEEVTEEAFKWLASFPKLVKVSCLISRVLDDITSHQREQEIDHVASTVECYMKEHSVDVEEAYEKLRAMVDDGWKEMNEECLRPTPFPRALIDVLINLTRVVENTHGDVDSYVNSTTTMKDNISLLFLQPIN